jgi:hypothetical protein
MGMGAAPCTFFCARCHTHTPGRFRPSELGAGQILNGDGNHPRYSLIVASMVKRRPVFSQSAYGTWDAPDPLRSPDRPPGAARAGWRARQHPHLLAREFQITSFTWEFLGLRENRGDRVSIPDQPASAACRSSGIANADERPVCGVTSSNG